MNKNKNTISINKFYKSLFLKIKYFLFMNFLEDVHEHTWIIKNFKYILYMNFCKDYRECHGGISYPDRIQKS